jgi:hypothetical protein
MPSLPPRDGVDAPLCAGIRAGTSTISPVDTLSSVAGKSLPPPPAGEHDPWAAPPAPLARADPPEYGDPPGSSVGLMASSPMLFGASTPSYSPHSSVSFKSMGGEYTPMAWPTPPSDETNQSSRLTSSARSTRQLAHPSQPLHCMGGSLGPMAPSPLNHQVKCPSTGMARPPLPARLTKTTSPQRTLPLSSPSQPSLNRGGASLAEHQAATVLQCWKRRIWLRRWFDQQATLKQKRLRLQALCRGASAYASLVWGYHCPPPTPTKKTSNPKVLRHPFRTRGQPLPPRKRGQRHKRPHRHPGRRHRPRAPDSGGGLSCMPLIF